MERAEVAVELLLTRDPQRGLALAQELCQLNRERQAIECSIFEACAAHLARRPELLGRLSCWPGEGWHRGGGHCGLPSGGEILPPRVYDLSGPRPGQGFLAGPSAASTYLPPWTPARRCWRNTAVMSWLRALPFLEENIPAFHAAMDRLVADYADHHPMTAVLDVDADINDCALLTCRQIDELSLLEPFGSRQPPSLCCACSGCRWCPAPTWGAGAI